MNKTSIISRLSWYDLLELKNREYEKISVNKILL
nr:MAG TPA: hypothetical protein [Caudoviricetes sp.]